MRWIWDLISVSLAAQLGTAPLAIYYFSQFPNYFLLANLAVIPLSSLVIYLAMALFAVFKVPYINAAVSFLLEWTIKIMNYCVKFIENLPDALGITYLTFYEMILLYGVIFSFGFLLYQLKFRPLAAGLACLSLFFASVAFKNIENENFNQLTIFNDNKNFTLNIADNQTNTVLTNDSSTSTKLTKTFFVRHNAQIADYEEFDTINFGKPIFYCNQKILVLYENNFFKTYTEKPLNVDYLVVTKNIYPNENLFKYYFSPKTLVIAGNVSANNTLKFKTIAQKFEIPCYSIKDEGAFILTNQ
jgi:competence protein ComEC